MQEPSFANEVAHVFPGQTFPEGGALGPRLAGSRLYLVPAQARAKVLQELGEGSHLEGIGQELSGIQLSGIHGIHPE
jgi:hypothetical protein